jgi:hypothetical protein
VPRHVARLVVDHFGSRRLVVGYFAYAARLGAWARRAARRRRLVVDHFGSRRLVVGYFAYAARLGAWARRAARRRPLHCVAWLVARFVARLVIDYFASRRLVVDHFAASCGSSHGSSSTTLPHAGSSSTTSPTPRVRVLWHVAWLIVDNFTSRKLVIDYFAYIARSGRAARCAARRRLLCLHRASGCLGTSRGSSSTTSPTLRVRVPRHVAWFVAWPVVDYFASRRLVVDYFGGAVSPLDFLSVGCTSSRRAPGHSVSRLDYSVHGHRDFAATLALLQPRCASRLPVSRQHRLYIEYAARHYVIVLAASRRPLILISFPN